MLSTNTERIELLLQLNENYRQTIKVQKKEILDLKEELFTMKLTSMSIDDKKGTMLRTKAWDNRVGS